MPPKDMLDRPSYAAGMLPHLPRGVLEERQRHKTAGHSSSTAASANQPPPRRPNVTTSTHTTAEQPPVKMPPLASSPSRKRSASHSHPDRASSPSKSSRTISTLNLRNDRLGTLVRELSDLYANAPSWTEFVESFRGRSYLAETVGNLPHPAAPLLDKWRLEGVPILSTSEPWSTEDKDTRFERGCHPSALEHADFLREEFAEFIERKFWVVLPYELVRDLPQLQLSPAAVKDERDRKPRLLCDHSWYPINDTTLPHVPLEAMQFGGALPRILSDVRHANPRYGPTRLSKHDIKDGFYRMYFRAEDCPKLAIMPPRYPGETPLVAIPMACTMGWTMSPPTFSAMSETTTDVANARFQLSPRSCPTHRLSTIAEEGDDLDPSPVPRPREPEQLEATNKLRKVVGWAPLDADHEIPDETAPTSNMPRRKPLGRTDVFVDDFIQLGQGGTARMRALRDHLLHTIDQVLAQPLANEAHRAEAVSLKKLLKGDGSWATRKLILGWIIDTLRQTLEIPAYRKAMLADIFEDLKGRKRVGRKAWQSILGKLRFVSIAIPGSAGLFSALQLALNEATQNRIKITKHLRRHIHDFALLAADLCSRPTHLAEIVPEAPTSIGATDAAKAGMGGVFFDHEGKPFVWREEFPPEIQQELITFETDGTITNSDLEQAAVLTQLELSGRTLPLRYATVDVLCDNTPAVSRFRKGAVSSASPAAYLCRMASLHQRENRYHARVFYMPGELNRMADDASRLHHLTNEALLQHFEQHYPQEQRWTLLEVPTKWISSLILALRCRSPPQSIPRKPRRNVKESSPSGASSVATSRSTHPCGKWWAMKRNSATSSSSAYATDEGAAVDSPSKLAAWAKPCWRWARGSPTWVDKIPEKSRSEARKTIPYWLLSSRNSVTTMNQRSAPSLPPSTLYERSPTHSSPHTTSTGTSTNMSSSCASLHSSGSCDRQNTWDTLPETMTEPAAHARRHSDWKTSLSRSVEWLRKPRQRL